MIITTPKDWFVAIRGRRYDAVSRHIQQFSGSRTSTGDTGLIISVQQHDPDMVKILAPTEAGLVNNSGSTALLVAAELGYLACCLPLLQYERSVVDSHGCTPLMLAARAGSIGCIPFLTTDLLLARDCEGRNALDWAVAAKQIEAVRLLSQPELYPIDDIRCAIDLADSMGHLGISKVLCRRIAGCQGIDSISPPTSVIISTIPSIPKAQIAIPHVPEKHEQAPSSRVTGNDSSMCLDDLSTVERTVPTIPNLSLIQTTEDSVAKAAQQLELLTKVNTALQSSYQGIAALCDEARLKLTMQKDSIESSVTLLARLKAILTDRSEATETEATRRVFQQRVQEIDSLQHEIRKITLDLHDLTATLNDSFLAD